MTMPNFLIIGAARSGTTMLNYNLGQHPEIYMSPIKETNFFALENGKNVGICDLGFPFPGDYEYIKPMINRSITSIDEYRALFQGIAGERAIGEASPFYLYSPRAAGRIKHYIPSVKLIAILRNPVEVAYSRFLQDLRSGDALHSDFAQALRQEELNIRENQGGGRPYLRYGFYYNQLKHYFDIFDRDNIKIYLYENLKMNPTEVFKDVLKFLCVDSNFTINTSLEYNASGIPRYKALDTFLGLPSLAKSLVKRFFTKRLVFILASQKNKLQNWNLKEPPKLSPEVRRQLMEQYYHLEIPRLQDLIQHDLSGWVV